MRYQRHGLHCICTYRVPPALAESRRQALIFIFVSVKSFVLSVCIFVSDIFFCQHLVTNLSLVFALHIFQASIA